MLRDKHSKCSNDFEEFISAKQKLEAAQRELSELLTQCGVEVRDSHDLLALCIALKRQASPQRN